MGAEARNYLEWYQQDLAPRLKDIDLLIKTSEQTISIRQAAAALRMDEDELTQIMEKEDFKTINKNTFMKIMAKGDSPICALYRRELECGSPYVYTIEDIAYIYGVGLPGLRQVCKRLNIKEITAFTLPFVLAEIPAPRYAARSAPR